jgi:hypothetical protein
MMQDLPALLLAVKMLGHKPVSIGGRLKAVEAPT